MTVKKETGMRLSCLSTDSKPTPTDYSVGSLLIETDTSDIYVNNGSEWINATEDCPRYIYLISGNLASGQHSLSSSTWGTSYAMINQIIVSSNSSNWSLLLYPSSSFSDYDPIPRQFIFNNVSGNNIGYFNFPYHDFGDENSVHIEFLPSDSSNASIYVIGYKMKSA